MYPPNSNNCSYSPLLSSSFNIPSPWSPYEHELFFQSYHEQVSLIEDQSFDILAESTETVTNPSDSVQFFYNTETVTSNQGPEEKGVLEGCENKGVDMRSGRTSIIRGRITKNKRSSNKDRHSKINTARGPRDRRMRLSLDAARKFFSLQDLLGFDKPSKTVEWLFIKSEAAIEELAKGANGGVLPKQSCSTTGIGAICASDSISECEVISGTDETSSNDRKETAKGGPSSNKEKKKAKTARRAAFEPLSRELRNLARARARERTKAKKSLIGKPKTNVANWRPFKDGNKMNHSLYEVAAEIEELTSLGAKENSAGDCNLVNNENWNPFSIFNYPQNAGFSHEPQFTDFQFCGKLWEV